MVLFACFFVQSAGAALHHAVVLKHDGVVEGGTGTLHEETGKENH